MMVDATVVLWRCELIDAIIQGAREFSESRIFDRFKLSNH